MDEPGWSSSALAIVGLVSVFVAWLSGVHFVSSGASDLSFFMALWTGMALLCDVLIVFSLTFEAAWAVTSRSD